MSDLISRSALMEELARNSIVKIVVIGDKTVWDIVKDQPTIEAVEVVRGEWMKTFRYMRENMNTGKLEPIHSYDCPICKYHTGNQGKNFNFCPNCGADMRKGGTE